MSEESKIQEIIRTKQAPGIIGFPRDIARKGYDNKANSEQGDNPEAEMRYDLKRFEERVPIGNLKETNRKKRALKNFESTYQNMLK